MRDRLVQRAPARETKQRSRRRPHFAEPRSPGKRRLSRRRLGLLVAFVVAIAANLIVILAHSSTKNTAPNASLQLNVPTIRVNDVNPVEKISLIHGLFDPPPASAGQQKSAYSGPQNGAPEVQQKAKNTSEKQEKSSALSAQIPVEPEAESKVLSTQLRERQTVAGALLLQGLQSPQVNGVIGALKEHFDFRSARPGDRIRLRLDSKGQLEHFEYRARAPLPGALYIVERKDGALVGSKKDVEVDTKRALVSGSVHSTLYESMLATGEGTSLIRDFTEVFGWEIDFYREVKEGDRFKIVVEKRYVEDKFVGYGKLLAAEYSGHGIRHRAFHFDDGKTVGYFNDHGESMQKTFLKSPVEITRITSGFGRRFHPIRKQHRAHNGVDYGAPKGTPVWTIADGVVTGRTYDRGLGNYVKVRHPNGYETVYGHLSKFAKDIKVGGKVRQRQVIGLCGSTGMSTGPHVHLGMKKNGHYVNPQTQKFPRGKALPKSARSAFAKSLQELAKELDAVEIALAQEHLPGQG